MSAPLPTGGKSASVSLTVMGLKGAPKAAFLTAEYWRLPGNTMSNWELANTCLGSGHSGNVSSGDAAQMKALFLDWETP